VNVRKPYLIVSIAAALLVFWGNLSAQNKVSKSDLEHIVKTMSGGFSSEAQSIADSAFFNISLKMKPIWQNIKGANWLYVEQAMAAMLQKPYRQRVYKVELLGDTAISSTVFELPNPFRFIGGIEKPELLSRFSPDSLIYRVGCAIILKKNTDQTFSGSTVGKGCLSSLRGASYATSKVTISDNKIVSWDQGWDKEDKQIWGAVKGGYIFEKRKSW